MLLFKITYISQSKLTFIKLHMSLVMSVNHIVMLDLFI